MTIVNARMYSVTSGCKADWHRVLDWALRRAGLGWAIVDFDAPAPLNELWARTDLGAAMMCGLPFARREPRPTLIAAPVPSPARYAGRPIYFSDIVVAVDSPHRTLEDTFGGVVGYTLADSMSGGLALRHHLTRYRSAERSRLYASARGHLVNARGVIEALAAGAIDVGPLDSYSHDLLRRNDPTFAARVRVIGHTAARPIPPIVATARIAGADLAALREALLACGHADDLAEARQRLLLSGFAFPDPADYDVLAQMACDDVAEV